MKLTREKCLELAGSADPNNYIESLVRASVALGMEMAADKIKLRMFVKDGLVQECINDIRKLAEEVQRG